MWCRPLHIEQRCTGGDEPIDETHEGDLRGVGRVAEHGLAGGQLVDPHTVETTDEMTVEMCLEAVHPTQVVEFLVGVDELRRDPSMWSARVAAALHHFAKPGVHAHLVSAAAPTQRARHDQAIERDHTA